MGMILGDDGLCHPPEEMIEVGGYNSTILNLWGKLFPDYSKNVRGDNFCSIGEDPLL